MNEYEIVSPRVGEPGTTYTPTEGINVEALLAGGFIKAKSKTKKAVEGDTENGD
jgi:hypothetical protein